MTLTEEIEQAQSCFTSHPPNESATCWWVISPLLHAVGYERRDILPHIADANGQFPDYTVLPDTPHAWYVEAKAWTVNLVDSHAQQALNYANNNGKRWVVLTNGQTWRLYDNAVQGYASDKLILQARLEDPSQFERFMRAISRDNVVHGYMEVAVRLLCLETYVSDQMQRPDGELITTLLGVIRRRPGMSSVTAEEVLGLFRRGPEPQEAPASQEAPAPPENHEPRTSPPDSQDHGSDTEVNLDGLYSLDDLALNPASLVTGKKPVKVVTEGTEVCQAESWADVAATVVAYIGQKGSLPPLPYSTRGRGRTYFLNFEPVHQHGPMRGSRRVTTANGDLFVDTHHSGVDLLSCLRSLCRATNTDPALIRVQLRPQVSSEPPV